MCIICLLYTSNFIAGIFRGVGIGIGVTIITAILVIILQRIVALNIPVIGEYIACLLYTSDSTQQRFMQDVHMVYYQQMLYKELKHLQ